MKYFFIAICLIVASTGCKPKILDGKDLENKLIKTMQEYLDKGEHPNSVKFTVKDVSFFTEKEKKEYSCEFHVNMKTEHMDTTGLMTATIPNDFSRVDRIR